ncbi:DUF2934 domain-containing protein [Pararhizobium sp. DWP1-1-3]|uniref:DUF2934 domain-containing protein n=1 Tax=Pararhizobium sp. DWP1-1-3 TaxID=2804652 RepID=UPI003CF07A74
MINREQLIKEHAFSLWETEGNPDGRHEDNWVQAEREIDGADTGSHAVNSQRPPEMDLEAIPPPDRASSGVPPAFSNPKNLVVGAGPDNPIHHVGQQRVIS